MSQIEGRIKEARFGKSWVELDYWPALRDVLPLPWPEFNRRAKLYFREVVERNRK